MVWSWSGVELEWCGVGRVCGWKGKVEMKWSECSGWNRLVGALWLARSS